MMPYPNEHSARVKDPGDFQKDSFRRKNIAPGVDIVMGRLKGEDTMTAQAYRFDKDKFTAEEAKKWCKEHDVKYISFEPAENASTDAASVFFTMRLSGVPLEIQVIPYGRHETSKGLFILDEEGMAAIIADFNSRENDMVIDYEHQTLGGGEAPAAGWIKNLLNKGRDGLWAVVEWTDRAAEYLKNREYRYLSPVFLKAIESGRVLRFLNAALTNQPAIDGMVPLVNKLKQEIRKEEQMKRVLEALGLKADAKEEQAVEVVMALQAMTGKTREVLGLKEDAKPKDVETAITAMKASLEAYESGNKNIKSVMAAHTEVMQALGLKEGASLSEVKGAILAMKQGSAQTGDLAKEVAALKDKLAQRDAEDLVAAAMKEGKITPAMKDWAVKQALKDQAGFEEFVAKQPVIVDEKERSGGDGPAGGDRAKKRETLIQEHMKAHNVEYKEALLEVSKENPELFRD